jgi:Na+-transporting NADH:ubiquinone oxidoreductase subunit NqrB
MPAATLVDSRIDPRLFQIAFLVSFLAAGLFRLEFRLEAAQVFLTFASGLAAQAFFLRRLKLQPDYRSALITCLGLCLLLRSDTLWAHPAAAAAGIAGKFVLRARGKHLFNPANLGVVLMLSAGHAWISPAQWGHEAITAAWVLLLGAAVVSRARRADVSLAFLGSFLGLCALRILWLGQRWAVLGHRLDDGSLLLFTFFMISDPRTIPDSRRGRLALAFLTALFAFVWQFGLYRYDGLFYALFVLTPTTVLWDRLWPGEKHRWEDRHEDRVVAGRTLPLPA